VTGAVSNATEAFPAIPLAQLGERADQRCAGLAIAAEALSVGLDDLVEAIGTDYAVRVGLNAVFQSATAMVAAAFAFVAEDRDGHFVCSNRVCD